jgi:hypothetical protein
MGIQINIGDHVTMLFSDSFATHPVGALPGCPVDEKRELLGALRLHPGLKAEVRGISSSLSPQVAPLSHAPTHTAEPDRGIEMGTLVRDRGFAV